MSGAFTKVVVVGASSGIGEAIAKRLSADGAKVALVARRKDELVRVKEGLVGHDSAFVYPHDVTRFDEVPALFDRIVADLGGLDLIVYAAGVMPKIEESEYSFDKDRQMVEVNLLGAMAWFNPAAARFEAQRSGTLVGISSIAGERGRRGNPAYCTSKAALTTYLESLRNRLSRYGVNVVTIKPGFVDTQMTRGMKGLFWLISPSQAAETALAVAHDRQSPEVFVPARWSLVALVVRLLPSFIFGRAVRAASRYAAPTSADELSSVVDQARREGLSVTFRGSGRSYGDAALNGAHGAGLIVDGTRMNKMLAWDPVNGIAEVQGGLTIEGLWRRTITDGYWPQVVPGTMFPTMGGCLSMNIHGKNNFKAGPFGEHVLDFDLVTPEGQLLRCSPQDNADVFFTAIGGLGLLGAITRVRIKLHRVGSGFLRVDPCAVPNLKVMFEEFEKRLPYSDYLVGWMDCLAEGAALGRGEIHQANYLTADEDPLGPLGFHTERQTLPTRILGFPKDKLWHFMGPFLNNIGVRFVNTAKMISAERNHGKKYLQSHVGFAFLLDYVPNWRLAYGDGGFIQYQVFVPKETAQQALEDILVMCKEASLPSYLGVLKRHRPDAFVMTHALDGYSLAMDFRVTAKNRERLWALTRRMTDRVLLAGGRFYFAKDAVLDAEQVRAAYGEERLGKFRAMKERLDPNNVLVSDLGRRALGLS